MSDRCGGTGAAAVGGRRSFLILQGPQSYFFERLGRALIARGHCVHRVNFNLGDRLFWRLPATNFRGRLEDWPAFVAGLIEKRGITDLLLLGDQRPYHVAAGEAARRLGARVWVTDLGYLRPGWLTLERDGTTGFSHFPRDRHVIRALDRGLPEPNLTARFATPFWQLAICDVAYHVAAAMGRPLYPHHRRHGIYHPFAEYAGWIVNAPHRIVTRRPTAAAKARLAAEPGSYFLFPLQLATDFQLRAHSPFADARDAVRMVMKSFAENGGHRHLVIVGHPLDEGLINWRRLIPLDGRITFLEGGVTNELVKNAAGIVTVNSTVGLTALRLGIPVKVLGSAIYDVAGLTHPGDLADFWHSPQPPDMALVDALVRALVGTTQISGNYHGRAAQKAALSAFIERLESGIGPLPTRQPALVAGPA